MKKILAVLITLALLAGCAATNYKISRSHGNDVKNGMTVADAISIIGLPPTDQDENHIEWRRGNAQVYDGTKNGSIRYQILDGKVVNIPDGGIYSEAAVLSVQKLRAAARAKAEKDRAEADAAKRLVEYNNEAANRLAEANKLEDQLIKESAAERKSAFTCADKVVCAKAFALAQIFVSNNSDQKIQVATDTIIETYNPTDGGKLGMKIVKTPSRGTSEVISLSPNCKVDKFSALLCSTRRTRAYEEFHPFIENALSK